MGCVHEISKILSAKHTEENLEDIFLFSEFNFNLIKKEKTFINK